MLDIVIITELIDVERKAMCKIARHTPSMTDVQVSTDTMSNNNIVERYLFRGRCDFSYV